MPTSLQARDRVVLSGLRDYADRFAAGREHVEWARIMDVCKMLDSQSSMKRLVMLGLAERRQRADCHTPQRSRASYEYKITPAGVVIATKFDPLAKGT